MCMPWRPTTAASELVPAALTSDGRRNRNDATKSNVHGAAASDRACHADATPAVSRGACFVAVVIRSLRGSADVSAREGAFAAGSRTKAHFARAARGLRCADADTAPLR